MPKSRVRILRGEAATSVVAEVEGDVVRLPTSSLPYQPHPSMGLTVDGRRVSAVEVVRVGDPPAPVYELTLTPA
jgi:hypothetical protein